MRKIASCLLTLLAITACGGGEEDKSAQPSISNLTPSQLCASIAVDVCQRAFACPGGQPQRFGYQGNEGDCQAELLTKWGCVDAKESRVCGDGSSVASASQCSDAVQKATCEQILSANGVAGCAPCTP